MSKMKSEVVEMNRRDKADRREDTDRRTKEEPVAENRRTGDRRKVQRRRQIDPTTCERDYSNDEIEFMQALDQYKRDNGRMFPTCSEILEVIRGLGYRRLTAQEIEDFNDYAAMTFSTAEFGDEETEETDEVEAEAEELASS